MHCTDLSLHFCVHLFLPGLDFSDNLQQFKLCNQGRKTHQAAFFGIHFLPGMLVHKVHCYGNAVFHTYDLEIGEANTDFSPLVGARVFLLVAVSFLHGRREFRRANLESNLV